MKKKVRMLTSIAGSADPKPTAELDKKYASEVERLKGLESPPTRRVIDEHIEELKLRDRYGDPAYGFSMDFSFKPGDEIFINAALADAWEECGHCTILTDVAPRQSAGKQGKLSDDSQAGAQS